MISPFPGILSAPMPRSPGGHWHPSISAKAASAWEMLQGVEVQVTRRADAPCPRCGKDLRSAAHDRGSLVPFYESDGVDIRAGFWCRGKAP